MGTWLRLDPDDWTDRDNKPGQDMLEGTAVKVHLAPWPLTLIELSSGQQLWIHVRREALEAAIIEETTT